MIDSLKLIEKYFITKNKKFINVTELVNYNNRESYVRKFSNMTFVVGIFTKTLDNFRLFSGSNDACLIYDGRCLNFSLEEKCKPQLNEKFIFLLDVFLDNITSGYNIMESLVINGPAKCKDARDSLEPYLIPELSSIVLDYFCETTTLLLLTELENSECSIKYFSRSFKEIDNYILYIPKKMILFNEEKYISKMDMWTNNRGEIIYQRSHYDPRVACHILDFLLDIKEHNIRKEWATDDKLMDFHEEQINLPNSDHNDNVWWDNHPDMEERSTDIPEYKKRQIKLFQGKIGGDRWSMIVPIGSDASKYIK
ncbi:MAG: hypothetical protein Hyperionvirus4_145 [Hyperionvirus sp.]|uniref:Uncharacterized protein n=1 Tax=Hyperionvirus sp. TaxID=2487770 RepID=A0A3G5A7D5_9VIRU|nr:MAG: hypothetical protein Hyperionvirus4_145 [Hyperionvirus sp.]